MNSPNYGEAYTSTQSSRAKSRNIPWSMAGVIRTRTPGLGTANVAYKERIQRGFFTGVPCCAGAGSRGIKLRPHAAIFPPRGPSAVYKRPSRPFGLRPLTQMRVSRRRTANGRRLNAKLCSWQLHNFKQINKTKEKPNYRMSTARQGQGKADWNLLLWKATILSRASLERLTFL